jgi:hypothetical protein
MRGVGDVGGRMHGFTTPYTANMQEHAWRGVGDVGGRMHGFTTPYTANMQEVNGEVWVM